jgi:hypothetical protein
MKMVVQQNVTDYGNAGLRRHLIQNRCQQFLGPIRLEVFFPMGANRGHKYRGVGKVVAAEVGQDK